MNMAAFKVLEGTNANKLIEVMFNPSEYTDSKSVSRTGEGPQTQFKMTRMDEFTVELFFDTYSSQSSKDVRKRTNELIGLVMPLAEGVNQNKPPKCLFMWGDFTYEGYVTKISQKFTMFLDDGTPVRAIVNVTLKSDVPKEQVEKDQGKDKCRKLWTVKSSDRLDLIAFRALKDAAKWRKIAEANQIINPLTFPTENDIGRQLVIPD
jgi:hypothetical protein